MQRNCIRKLQKIKEEYRRTQKKQADDFASLNRYNLGHKFTSLRQEDRPGDVLIT
jgi:hypothetical protein